MFDPPGRLLRGPAGPWGPRQPRYPCPHYEGAPTPRPAQGRQRRRRGHWLRNVLNTHRRRPARVTWSADPCGGRTGRPSETGRGEKSTLPLWGLAPEAWPAWGGAVPTRPVWNRSVPCWTTGTTASYEWRNEVLPVFRRSPQQYFWISRPSAPRPARDDWGFLRPPFQIPLSSGHRIRPWADWASCRCLLSGVPPDCSSARGGRSWVWGWGLSQRTCTADLWGAGMHSFGEWTELQHAG